MSSNEEIVRARYRAGDEENRASRSRYSGIEFYYTQKHIGEYIRPESAVIELGCGTGYYAMRFAGQCASYLGVDLSPEHIAIFHEKIRGARLENVSARVGDATRLGDIADCSFDVVLCLGPMYHLPEQERERVFSECARICKPGGTAVFAYINRVGVYAGGCVHDQGRADYPNERANELVLNQGRDDLNPDLFYYTMPEEMEAGAARHGLKKLKNLGTDFFITLSVVEGMSDERFRLMKPLMDQMAGHESCTGMSNHALLICKKGQAAETEGRETLATRRMLLRPARARDAESLQTIRNSGFVLAFNAMNRLSMAEMEKMVEKDSRSKGVFYMERRADGRLMGAVYASEDSMRHEVQAVELSYYLGEEYARQGYMTEALEAVLDRIFAENRAELVSARVFADNAASRGLVERLGFRQDGCLRRAVKGYGGRVHDDCLYSLLRAEWMDRDNYKMK